MSLHSLSNIEYNFYFGNPHAHTSYSDGEGNPIEAFEYARKRKLDFLFISDHSNFLDGVKHRNFEYDKGSGQYIEKEGSEWFKTRQAVEYINNRYKDFTALRGFEMRWFAGGHMSVLNSQNYLNGRKQHLKSNMLAEWLTKQINTVAVINHPGRSFKPFKCNYELNKVLRLIEVGNGSYPRGYLRYESYYYKLLDLGWELGAINGQDNHIGNWGDDDNLTVILAETLSSEALINAMKKLRTYSTETRSLKLIFKADNFWMGSKIIKKPGSIIDFEIIAEDSSAKIDRIQLISNGGRVIIEKQFKNQSTVFWRPYLAANSAETWYIVKVIHSNGKFGISSPIFININS